MACQESQEGCSFLGSEASETPIRTLCGQAAEQPNSPHVRQSAVLGGGVRQPPTFKSITTSMASSAIELSHLSSQFATNLKAISVPAPWPMARCQSKAIVGSRYLAVFKSPAS